MGVAGSAKKPRNAKSTSIAPETDTPFDPAKQVLWSRPGYLVRRLNQIHYALFFEECETENITPVQYGILTALSLQPWLDQTSIGMELGLDRTTTADVIKRLELRELVRRRVNPNDARSRQAAITRDGRKLMGKMQTGMYRAQERLLAPLPPRKRQVFMDLLSTLVDANNEYCRSSATLRSI